MDVLKENIESIKPDRVVIDSFLDIVSKSFMYDFVFYMKQKDLGSLVIRVAHICTVSHYKTKPLSGASIGGKSEEVKSRSEKLWIGRRKSFLYMVTM